MYFNFLQYTWYLSVEGLRSFHAEAGVALAHNLGELWVGVLHETVRRATKVRERWWLLVVTLRLLLLLLLLLLRLLLRLP